MKRLILVVLLGLGLVLAGADDLFAMRCNNALVLIGDRQFEVLSKCGEPDFARERTEDRFVRVFREGRFFEIRQDVTVEEWTYNFGPNRFIRILRFENGRLVEIEMGGYGY
jgi:hypothetical protein